jgi:hypothetical protein
MAFRQEQRGARLQRIYLFDPMLGFPFELNHDVPCLEQFVARLIRPGNTLVVTARLACPRSLLS